MQFLANENFPFDAVDAVRALGHDVAWVRVRCRTRGWVYRVVLAKAVGCGQAVKM